MRKTLLLSALSCLVALPVMAKTYQLPDDNPAVSVMLPDKWEPKEVEKGVEATSPDGETYVSLETATAKGMDKLIEDDIQFLTRCRSCVGRARTRTAQRISPSAFMALPATWCC
jgi:hypothetical protein